MQVFIKPTKPATLQFLQDFAKQARLLGVPLVWDGDENAFKVEKPPVAPWEAHSDQDPAPQPTPLDQIVFALERAQVMLRREANSRDYNSQFPYEDAERLGEAIQLLNSSRQPDFAKAARILAGQAHMDWVDGKPLPAEEAALRVVFASIRSERVYQDAKWGAGRQHEVGAWLGLMQVYLSSALRAWAHSKDDDKALDYLRKVLALGTACGEHHGLPGRTQ